MEINLAKDVALQLLANAGATVGALIALISMFGPISCAHFNPVVTAATYIFNVRQARYPIKVLRIKRSRTHKHDDPRTNEFDSRRRLDGLMVQMAD